MSKKKILLMSDDIRVPSGVGTMSKKLVLGTLDKYDWVQIGGAVKHPEAGKIFDLSEEVQKQDYKLTPGIYVGTEAEEDDGIPFEEKMTELTRTLYRQMEESGKLDAMIKENLAGLGYGE